MSNALVMTVANSMGRFDVSASAPAAVRCFDVSATSSAAATLECLHLLCVLPFEGLHLLRVLTL